MFGTYEGKFEGLNYFTKMPKGDTKINEASVKILCVALYLFLTKLCATDSKKSLPIGTLSIN
jgi:hypothetical protein